MQHIGFFIFPHFKAMDLSVPMDCFAEANLHAKDHSQMLPYELHLLAPAKQTTVASNGIVVEVSHDIHQNLALDILILVGGSGVVSIGE